MTDTDDRLLVLEGKVAELEQSLASLALEAGGMLGAAMKEESAARLKLEGAIGQNELELENVVERVKDVLARLEKLEGVIA